MSSSVKKKPSCLGLHSGFKWFSKPLWAVAYGKSLSINQTYIYEYRILDDFQANLHNLISNNDTCGKSSPPKEKHFPRILELQVDQLHPSDRMPFLYGVTWLISSSVWFQWVFGLLPWFREMMQIDYWLTTVICFKFMDTATLSWIPWIYWTSNQNTRLGSPTS